VGLYAELVNAASEAATLAALRALRCGALNLHHDTPAPHGSSRPDGSDSERDDLQPFKRTCPSVPADM
jgi:hypothetical protein